MAPVKEVATTTTGDAAVSAPTTQPPRTWPEAPAKEIVRPVGGVGEGGGR